MLNKKGVAWNLFLEFVLGAIILSLIIALFFPNLIPYPSKIWNETRSAFDKHEGEFKPYEDQLTPEEKSIDDSMKALMCAGNSVALGAMDKSYCSSSGGIPTNKQNKILGKAISNPEQIECDGILFGTKCVECSQRYTYGSEDNKIRLNGLSEAAIECNKLIDKSWDDEVCGIIPPYSIEGTITEAQLIEWLKKEGGEEGKKLVESKTIKVYPSPFDTTQRYYIFADDDLGDYIFFLSRDVLMTGKLNGKEVQIYDVRKKYDKWLRERGGSALERFDCKVIGFELPQKIDTGSAERYIKGVGDPKYLTYYEKFPEGEEKSWQFEPKTMVLVGLGVRTALVLVPFAGKLFSKTTGFLLKGYRLEKLRKLVTGLDMLDDAQKARRLEKIGSLLDKLSKNERYLTEGLEVLVKTGQKEFKVYALISDNVADDIAQKLLFKIDEVKTANLITKTPTTQIPTLTPEGKKIIKDELQTLFKGSNIDVLPQGGDYAKIYHEIASGQLDDVSKIRQLLSSQSNLEKVGIAVIEKASLSQLSQIGRKMGFRRMLKAMMVDHQTGKLSHKGLEKAIKKGVDGLSALKKTNPQLYDYALDDVGKLANEFIDEQGRINWGQLLGDSREESITTLLKTVDEGKQFGAEVTKMKDLLKGRTIGEGLWKGTITGAVGPLPAGTTWNQISQIIKNTAKGIGCVPGVGYAASKVTGIDKMCLTFIKDHFLPIMIGLGYFSKLQDKQMEKFTPIGKNNFMLLGAESESFLDQPTYNLQKANRYFVTLAKEDNSRSRFFAASPCLTDYKIQKNYCSCEMRYKDYVYKLQDGSTERLQTIEPPPITDISQIETVYGWNKLSEEDRVKFLVEENFFRKQSGMWGVGYTDGFDQIRSNLEVTPELLEEYHKVMFKEPDEFLVTLSLMHSYNGEVQAMKRDFGYPTQENAERTLGKFKDLIKIRSFTDEEFRKFQRALIEFYDEAETQLCSLLNRYKYCYDPFTYEYKKNGRNEKIEIPKIWDALDPTKGFVLFPVGKLRYYRSDRHELLITLGSLETMNHQINVGFFWYKKGGQLMTSEELKKKEQEDNYLWFNPKVDWQDKIINYQKLFSDLRRSYTSFPRMMAYRFYHSNFFDEIARKTAYHYFIYTGPTDNVAKKCEDTQLSEKVPNLNDINSRYFKQTIIPCLTIVSEGITDKYKDYNDGLNYCYSAKSWGLEVADDVLTGVSIVGGLVVMGLTGNPAVIAAVAVVDLGAIATSFIIEMCGDWPRHYAGLSECFG